MNKIDYITKLINIFKEEVEICTYEMGGMVEKKTNYFKL